MSDKSPEYLAQSKATGIYIAYAFPIPFAIISTSLRLWAEYRHHRRGLTYDDYLMLLTTVRKHFLPEHSFQSTANADRPSMLRTA